MILTDLIFGTVLLFCICASNVQFDVICMNAKDQRALHGAKFEICSGCFKVFASLLVG